jgi:hypothetical protein
MDLFDEQIAALDLWLTDSRRRDRIKPLTCRLPVQWPRSGHRNLVIGQEIGVELGHPNDASVSLVLYQETKAGAHSHKIRLLGPDLPTAKGQRLPFAKVVMVHGRRLGAENAHDRYRQLEAARYRIDSKGT